MQRWELNAVWFAAAAIATAAIAWVAFQLQQRAIAPAVLFPLAVGGVLGGTLVLLWRWTTGPATTTVRIAAVIGGLLAVVTQDYIGHVEWLRGFDAQLRDQPLAMAAADELRPTLAEHVFGRVRARPVWWTLDLVLTATAAGVVTALGTRREPVSRSPAPPQTLTPNL